MGDNTSKFGVELPPDMTESVFLAACRKMDEFEEMRKNLNAAIGRFRLDIKSQGVLLKQFDAVRVLRDMDPAEVKQQTADMFRYTRFLKLDTGTQAELFPKEADPVTKDVAYLAGFKAGLKGKGERKPPEELSSGKQQQAWLNGWDDGQKKIAFDVFGKKDYFDPASVPDTEQESAGPSADADADDDDDDLIPEVAQTDDGKVTKLADVKKAAADKEAAKKKPAAGSPEDVVSRVKDKPKKGTKSAAVKPAEPAPPAEPPVKRTKAEEAAANGGTGGLAPPGARKGGGDFDDDGNEIPARQAQPQLAPDDGGDDDDDDLSLEDDDDDLELEDEDA